MESFIRVIGFDDETCHAIGDMLWLHTTKSGVQRVSPSSNSLSRKSLSVTTSVAGSENLFDELLGGTLSASDFADRMDEIHGSRSPSGNQLRGLISPRRANLSRSIHFIGRQEDFPEAPSTSNNRQRRQSSNNPFNTLGSGAPFVRAPDQIQSFETLRERETMERQQAREAIEAVQEFERRQEGLALHRQRLDDIENTERSHRQKMASTERETKASHNVDKFPQRRNQKRRGSLKDLFNGFKLKVTKRKSDRASSTEEQVNKGSQTHRISILARNFQEQARMLRYHPDLARRTNPRMLEMNNDQLLEAAKRLEALSKNAKLLKVLDQQQLRRQQQQPPRGRGAGVPAREVGPNGRPLSMGGTRELPLASIDAILTQTPGSHGSIIPEALELPSASFSPALVLSPIVTNINSEIPSETDSSHFDKSDHIDQVAPRLSSDSLLAQPNTLRVHEQGDLNVRQQNCGSIPPLQGRIVNNQTQHGSEESTTRSAGRGPTSQVIANPTKTLKTICIYCNQRMLVPAQAQYIVCPRCWKRFPISQAHTESVSVEVVPVGTVTAERKKMTVVEGSVIQTESNVANDTVQKNPPPVSSRVNCHRRSLIEEEAASKTGKDAGNPWACPCCTFVNEAEHLQCDMCYTPRGSGQEIELDRNESLLENHDNIRNEAGMSERETGTQNDGDVTFGKTRKHLSISFDDAMLAMVGKRAFLIDAFYHTIARPKGPGESASQSADAARCFMEIVRVVAEAASAADSRLCVDNNGKLQEVHGSEYRDSVDSTRIRSTDTTAGQDVSGRARSTVDRLSSRGLAAVIRSLLVAHGSNKGVCTAGVRALRALDAQREVLSPSGFESKGNSAQK
jgi:hypothetical protein